MAVSAAKLRAVGIRRFDVPIHDQSRDWLLEHFGSGATKFPINVTKLIRNIIWQTRERIIRKEREPMTELIRTFWYTHIKSTLARAGALSKQTDQYAELVDQLVFLVRDKQLMSYSDIGFTDEGQTNRQVGLNAHVILFAEKVGHAGLLAKIAEKYQVSTIALGGQPSVLATEYFVADLKEKGVDIRRSFFLFSVVDFDTSGWIIRDAFVNNLHAFGIKHIRTTDLVNPDMLTADEIKLARFPIPDSKTTSKKNTQWLKEIRAENYDNLDALMPGASRGSRPTAGAHRRLYGLEAESVSNKRLAEKLDTLLPPLMGKSERILRIHHLEEIEKLIDELILLKIKGA